jgi:hypothetical protein
VAAELGPFIQEEDAVVGPRHLARQRHVAPADQSRIGDGVMGGATQPGRDQGRAVAGAAGDAMEARGLDGFGVIAGRKVVRRRASIDWAAPGGRVRGDSAAVQRCTGWSP